MVLRTFIALAFRLIDRRAHRETAAWDRDHIDPAGGTEPFRKYRGLVFFRRVPDPFRIDGRNVERNSPQRRF